MRSILTFSFLALALAATAPARAQTFTFGPYDGVTDDDLNEVELGEFFNMARCLCDADNSGPTYSFYLTITSPGPYEDTEVYFLLGDDCDTTDNRPNCHEFNSINYSDFNREQKLYIPLNRVVDPTNGECTEGRGTSTLHLFMTEEKDTTVASYPIDFDTQSPGVPTLTAVEPGENALVLRWDRPTSNDEDIEYFNVLCEVDGRAADISSSSKARWTTTEEICGKELYPETTTTQTDGGVQDAGVTDGALEASVQDADTADASTDGGQGIDAAVPDAAVPDAAPQADAAAPDAAGGDASTSTDCVGSLSEGDWPRPCFACGSVGETADSIRVSGLPNNVEVRVAVVAVDSTGNVSRVSNVMTGTPVPTTDFAEHYNASGGKGKQGFCFVATVAYGSYDHSNVRVLRRFRDQVLAKNALGRAFVSWYYKNGKRWADAFRGRPYLTAALKVALLPVVAVAWIWVRAGGMIFVLFGLFAALLFVYRRTRRNLRRAAAPNRRDPRAATGLNPGCNRGLAGISRLTSSLHLSPYVQYGSVGRSGHTRDLPAIPRFRCVTQTGRRSGPGGGR